MGKNVTVSTVTVTWELFPHTHTQTHMRGDFGCHTADGEAAALVRSELGRPDSERD